MKAFWIVILFFFLTQGHARFNPIPTFAVGQIGNETSYGKLEKQWVYQAGLRGRYLFPKFYLGGDAGIGIFDDEITSSVWMDIGLTKQFFEERLRINFGAGMAYTGFILSTFHSSNSFSKEYDHNVSPFISCDYEFGVVLLRFQYQPQSEYETRVAIGAIIF